MLDSIIHFSIKNKLIIGLLTIALCLWGVYSLSQLPVDAVPDITNNQVQVLTISPALSAQEVERFITAPLEISFANLPGQTEIRSISRSGLSVITVVFNDHLDVFRARQLVSEQIKIAMQSIPPGSGTPELAPITTGLGEIYQYVIDVSPPFASRYSLTDLRTIQDWVVKKQLAGVEGIAEVSSFGGFVKQYEISFDPQKLSASNVSIEEIFQALENNNENTGGSYIEKNHHAYFIRGEGLATSLEDLGNIVIKTSGNVPMLIKDVAKVQFGHAVRYGAMSKDGEEVVGGIVLMLKGANTNQVIGRVEARIAQVQKSLPEGLKINPYLNRADLIDRAIGTVERNLVEGGLIVVFVLVLLLGNFRAGLIVASVIPLALLFAFSMMNLFGVSANLMSLGAIDFGLVVDGAVIIVEAIIHQLAINSNKQDIMISQDEMDDTVYFSSVKIRNSAAFGEIIILMVYLPILALTGVEGKMFKPMAETVAFAIVGALLLSITYVPMVSSLFLNKKITHKTSIADRIIHFLYRYYRPALNHALQWRWAFTIGSIVLFLLSLILFKSLGGEFLPLLEEGNFAVDTRLASGSALTESIKTFSKAESILSKFPEVKEVVGRIGNSEIPTDPMPMEVGDLMIILKEKAEWTSAGSMNELGEKMKKALSDIPGCQFEFLQPIQMRTNELISGVRADVGIKIFGDDLETLFIKANECARLIQRIDGISDLKVEQIEGLPQMVVKYNRQRIAQYGVDIKKLNTIVRSSFAGEFAGTVFEGEKRFDLVVRMDAANRTGLSDIGKIYVELPASSSNFSTPHIKVPLEELADISFQEAPIQISRENSKRRISITFNVRHRDVESAVAEAKELMDKKMKLPPGYYSTFGGQFKNLIEAKSRLSIAVPVALAIIFVLLYLTFRSIKETLIIFTAIPLSSIGGILALWMRDMYFSISAGVGFIALFGVAVLNGIVLISYLNQLQAEGMTDVQARILNATHVRFRPVMLTALVASLGFLPMALSNTAGAEVQRPLATVVIGGLFSATLLTLIILPVLYSLTFDKKVTPKKNGNLRFFLFLIPLLIFAGSSVGQVNQRGSSLEQLISYATGNNASLQASSLLIDEQRKLLRSAMDIPKTVVDFQYGKIQDPGYNDYTITAVQQFASPSLYAAQRKVGRSQVGLAERRLEVERRLVSANIKIVYYTLLYNDRFRQLLKSQDSIYSEAYRVASLRFKTGETNNLENISALARLQEVKNRIEMLDVDFQIQKSILRRYLNIKEDTIDVVYDVPLKRTFTETDSFGTGGMVGNPTIRYYQQQAYSSKTLLHAERQRLLPNFSAGYFNQTIFRRPNNQGVMAGIGVPIWFTAGRSRIQAAKVFQHYSEKQLEYNQIFITSEFNIQRQLYQKYLRSIAYSENYALPQASQILANASLGYTRGDLDYVEFVQSISQVWQIQESYLSTIHNYNLAIIQMETLLGL